MRWLRERNPRVLYPSDAHADPDTMMRRVLLRLSVVATFVFVALQVDLRGAAIRPRYRIAGVRTQTGGAPAQWAIAAVDSHGERWIAQDTDGDGTWDEVDTPQGVFIRPTSSSPRRWLVVCLDGVPITAMQSLWDAGHFREFFRPTATVSTLPSDSEMALTAALHAEPVP